MAETMQVQHRCLFGGCTNIPTQMLETDTGLEGGLAMYFCDQHAAEFMQASKNNETDKLDLDRLEPEGATDPET